MIRRRSIHSSAFVVEGVLVRRRRPRFGKSHVAGVDGECGVVVALRTHPTRHADFSADLSSLDDFIEHGTCSETRRRAWRRECSVRRAGVLARRGVRLVLCTEEADGEDEEAFDAYAENGIEIAEGVSERDATRVCRVLRVIPCTSSLPNAFETCDVGRIDGFSAQLIGGDAFAYLKTDRAFTGVVGGVDFTRARATRNLLARALAAVATASVPSTHPATELAGDAVGTRG